VSNTSLENLQEKWPTVKFRDVILSLQAGFACGKRDVGGYVQLRMNNIGLEGRIITNSFLKVPKSETNFKKYVLENGDVIFNNTNSPELVGKTVLFSGELDNCVYSNHLTRIRVNKDLTTPEFVTHFLRLEQRMGTFQLLCRRFVGQAAVPKESLLNLDFPLPPINEQKRIVLKIEELFKESKSAREALDKIPQIMKRFRQSVLTKAFRGELIPQDPNDESTEKLLTKIQNERKKKWEEKLRAKGKDLMKFKYEKPEPIDSEGLIELPDGWIWTSAKQVCSKVTDGEHNKPKTYSTGIPMLTAKNVRDNFLDFNNTDYVDKEESVKFLARCNPEFGDVLVVCVGATTGRTSPVSTEKKFVLGRSVALLKPIHSILETRFLSYFLQSHIGQEQFRNLKKATAQEHIFINQFEDMAVPITSLKGQTQIVSKIDEFFSFADQIEKSVEEAKGRADKIDQSILAKAFRGDLVPQDPNDEPASLLLERIKQEKNSVIEQTSVKQRHK
jgi:type I restriction enzyme, S subunit